MSFYHNWKAQGKGNISRFSSSNPHRRGCSPPHPHILWLLPVTIQLSPSHISRKEKKKEDRHNTTGRYLFSTQKLMPHVTLAKWYWIFFLSWWFDPSSVEKMWAISPASTRAGLGPSQEEFTLQRYFLQWVSQLKQCWCGPPNCDVLTALNAQDSGLSDFPQTSPGTEQNTSSSGDLHSTAAVNTCKSLSIWREKVGLKWENKSALRLTGLVDPLAS